MPAPRPIARRLLTCLIALSACSGETTQETAPPPETAGTGPETPAHSAAAGVAASQPEVSLTVLAAEPTLKYPKAEWLLELEIHNPGPMPLWFLLPEPPEFSPGLERGAWAFEAVRLGSRETATAVRISATHALVAFRLAPQARLTLDDLSIDSWHPEPVPAVELYAVPEIRLDGRPLIGDWLGDMDPTISGTVRVDAGDEETLYEWFDPDLRSYPLTYAPQARWTLATGLDETSWPWRPRQ